MATTKKTAGRKPTAPAPKVGPEFIGKTPEADAKQELVLHQRMNKAIEQFGDSLPWHPEHYEAEIRSELRSGCESFLRAGRLLFVAHECASHGEWGGMLDRLGVEREQARRMMEAARRMANCSPASNLIAAAKSQSKLIELLSLPEDQFKELADTGETDGLTLDDIGQMTRNELREALREARADKVALDERNAKLQQTAERAELAASKAKRAWKEATPDEQLMLLRRDLDADVLQMSIRIVSQDDAVSSLRKRVAALIEHGEANGQDHRVYLAGVFAQLERYLHQVRDEFFIPHLAVGDPALEAQAMISGAKK